MAFKFYLDNQITDRPHNDTELLTTIKRDSSMGAFLITQDVTLFYSANNELAVDEISGYTYLKDTFDSGTCQEVKVDIYDEISSTESYLTFTGVIKVPDIVIEEGFVRLSVKLTDNSFNAYIQNNQNVKFSLYATKTKNGEAITPPQIYQTDFFYGQNGIYLSVLGALYQGYRIYDILKFLVPAISDNKVSFESDYLSTPDIQLFLFDGFALSHPNSQPNIEVSFAEIIRELQKLKDLSFYIDQTDPDNPVLRLEESAWFYIGTNVLSFDEPLHIKTSVKPGKAFGTIRVGSDFNPGGSAPVYTFNAGTSYFGWKEEVYTPFGQCNTDAELDLVNQFAISNNAINDQVSGVVNSNEDMLFIVEMQSVDTVAFTAAAVDYEIYGNAPKKFYNVGLNNVNKISLHGSNFQSALSNTQDPGSDICHISLGQDTEIANFNTAINGGTGSPYVLIPLPFADEFGGDNYDGGNNWDNVSYYYTAPQAGNYSFAVRLNFDVTGCKQCINGTIQGPGIPSAVFTTINWGIEISVGLIAYTDNTFTTVIGTAGQNFRTFNDGSYQIGIAQPIALPAGATVRAFTISKSLIYAPLLFGNSPLDQTIWTIGNCSYSPAEQNRIAIAQEDSYFECNGTPEGALILTQPDQALYKAKLHEFDYHITPEDFRAIAALPIGSFEFTKDSVTRRGWIEQMQHNNWTGKTNITLISQDATL